MKHTVKWLAFLLCMFIVLAQAKQEQATIIIEADVADFDKVAKVNTYRGHIKFKQDDTTIEGALAKIYFDQDNRIASATITGKPVRLIHTMKDHTRFEASAWQMRYEPKTQTVVLTGKAQVKDNCRQLQGDKITYLLDSARIIAEAEPGKQTHVFILTGRGD